MDKIIKSDLSTISIYHYPFSPLVNDKIANFIKSIGDVQNCSTNVKAVMTDWNITSPEIEELEEWIFEKVYLKEPKLRNLLCMRDCWGVVYNKENFTLEHNHSPAYLSFVYFLRSSKKASPLCFKSSKLKINPEPGKIIIFPSHLIHYVPPQKDDSERIILSGNIVAKSDKFGDSSGTVH